MADDVTLQSIKISATADTSGAVKALTNLAESIQKAATASAHFGSVTKGVASLTATIKQFNSLNMRGFEAKVDKLVSALEKISNANIDTKKVTAAVREANAITRKAELRERKQARNAANQIKSERLAAQSARAQILAENAKTARLKEERLAQKDLSGTKEKSGGRVSAEEKARRLAAKAQSRIDAGYSKWANGGAKTDAFLKRQTELMNKFAESTKKAAAAFAKFLGNLAIAPFKKLGSAVANIVKKFTAFLQAVKRIAIYRAIRALLKEITQAFREGVENMYQYSKLIDGQFAKSMDTLATSALYAKNSLGAMAAPIINNLAPVVDILVDKFVDLMNVINEFVASVSGAETWTRALKYPKEYADAIDGANGKAKELRATLLGFDEINRLDDNKRGSRGSAEDVLDYSKMFEEVAVTSKTGGIVKALKEAFEAGDFESIGKSIGDKLKKGLDNIPWMSIQDRVKKNASSVATLINGFIDTEGLGESLGATIGEVFNTAIGKMDTFFSTVHWRDLGAFLGKGFSSLVDKVDKAGLGSTLAKIVNAGISAVSGFIGSVDWWKISDFLSNGINNFFNDIHAKELGETIGKAIIKAANTIDRVLKQTDWESVGKKVGDFFKGINWEQVLSGLSQLFFDAIKAAADALGGLIKESPVFGSIAAIAVANKIASFLGAPKVTSILSTGLMKLLGGGVEYVAAEATGGAIASAATAQTPAAAAEALAQGSVFGRLAGALSSGAAVSTLPVSVVAIGAGAAALLGGLIGWGIQQIPGVAKAADSFWEALFGDPDADLRAHLNALKSEDALSVGFDLLGMMELDPETQRLLEVMKSDIATIKTNTNTIKGNSVHIQEKVDKLKVSVQVDTTHLRETKNLSVLLGYANGGYPETGSVFLAGERGAEIISSTAHGTQVANRDQISASVAMGMQEATEESNALLREQNALLQALLDKDTNAYITTDSIASAMHRSNLRSGRAIVSMGG